MQQATTHTLKAKSNKQHCKPIAHAPYPQSEVIAKDAHYQTVTSSVPATLPALAQDQSNAASASSVDESANVLVLPWHERIAKLNELLADKGLTGIAANTSEGQACSYLARMIYLANPDIVLDAEHLVLALLIKCGFQTGKTPLQTIRKDCAEKARKVMYDKKHRGYFVMTAPYKFVFLRTLQPFNEEGVAKYKQFYKLVNRQGPMRLSKKKNRYADAEENTNPQPTIIPQLVDETLAKEDRKQQLRKEKEAEQKQEQESKKQQTPNVIKQFLKPGKRVNPTKRLAAAAATATRKPCKPVTETLPETCTSTSNSPQSSPSCSTVATFHELYEQLGKLQQCDGKDNNDCKMQIQDDCTKQQLLPEEKLLLEPLQVKQYVPPRIRSLLEITSCYSAAMDTSNSCSMSVEPCIATSIQQIADQCCETNIQANQTILSPLCTSYCVPVPVPADNVTWFEQMDDIDLNESYETL